MYRIVKYHKNALKDDVYAGTRAHDQVLADNLPEKDMPSGLNVKGGDSSAHTV
ncbi:hypothetical protein [Companilactobacillus sp.]|uniref:hypothetical protein n=1 Tax=Companilactobacillus sp. TaxID=2767905 RepID=UPI002602C770|nr:hypothetical protein [Companilactobacillus sp.]